MILMFGLLLVCTCLVADDKNKNAIQFNRDIRPILSENCFACHGPDAHQRKSKLRLDVRESAIEKHSIVPGKNAESLLIERVMSMNPEEHMPPEKSGKKLTQQQIELLSRWIEQGAKYEKHWSLIAPERGELPKVKLTMWPKNPIDRFILARLEKEGLTPSKEADQATLLRRVTLDLTGLPPTLDELDAFLKDESPNAYDKVVDRLLQSLRFGEHLATHWLDLARYADTNGYNNDEERTQWMWRDWVINAFNYNKPYDQFITEQLAGDILPHATIEQKLATGFSRNHVLTTEGGIIEEEYRVEYVADRVHTTCTVFLGLSMQCARCHDHKFDPITQREYYSFFAFFNNIAEKTVGFNQARVSEPFLKIPTKEQQAEKDKLLFQKKTLTKQLIDRQASIMFDGQARKSVAELVGTNKLLKVLETAIPANMIMQEMPTPRKTFVLKRGQYDQQGEAVSPGVPASLPALPAGLAANRLSLAKWLVEPTHPLTARVAVNQWWHILFGTGIVETVEDLGSQGAWPSHPVLLDWMACELISSKWNVKAMIKRMVTSATYRQSSRVSPELLERDPKNRLLARGPRYRLSAETIRDNALAVSGLLKERIGGPSVMPYQPDGLWQDVSVERRAVYKQDVGDNLYRRSMYTFWKRTCPPPGMMTFDAPDRETCTIRRARTNTPLQALVLMNDPTYLEASRKLAERVMNASDKDEARLDHLYRLVLSRSPSAAERNTLLSLLAKSRDRMKASPEKAKELLSLGASPRDSKLNPIELAAWTTLCSLVFNLDETISKE
ncbi:MAG TPA: PSD1 and planctomycete cytochrome C domain-containing protein [Gemmatales bacterium]|nr:PSD1 and planctomycete cytochrome C domain-containing protein [Gemmatales bacterium]